MWMIIKWHEKQQPGVLVCRILGSDSNRFVQKPTCVVNHVMGQKRTNEMEAKDEQRHEAKAAKPFQIDKRQTVLFVCHLIRR